MWEFTSTAERILQLRRIVRRQTIRLVILTAVAAAAFLGTRALAIRFAHQAVEDAAAWYARGHELLKTGHAEQAAVAFRRATMKDRGERRYGLALADALARSGNDEAARRALLNLRELTPEDASVNLGLARLARARGDATDAIRYYQHAIYAPASTAASSRDLRFELVEFLLESSQDARAVSELIAASVELPDDPAVRLELAQLFHRAGNPGRALEQYARILQRDPEHRPAMEGAVHAAFDMGNYAAAARHRLPETASSEARARVAVAREVVSRDPLAARISAADRRRRLLLNLSYLEQRWAACHPDEPSGPPQALVDVRRAFRSPASGRDSDALEAAMTTIDRVRRELQAECGPAAPVDEAIGIIARLHGVAAR